MKRILEKIKKDIMPEETDEPKRFVKELNKRLVNGTAVIGGSFGKNTHLKNDYDVDVFVKYDYKTKNISKILGENLKKYYDVEEIRGSRTYFHIKRGNIVYEIVPVLNIRDARKAENSMDMSPLHVNWVRMRLIENPELANEIRLAKQFCKAQRVYGAESYIQGISGHVLDILVIHYGSFLELAKNASKWGDRAIIDSEEHYNNEDEIMKKMNKSKIVSPLIVVDPILPERNAAAALSKENYEKFKESCRLFLENPSEDFFRIKPIEKKPGKERVVLKIKTLDKREDIAGSKLVKAYRHILNKARRYGFEAEGEWEWDRKSEGFIVIKAKDIEKEWIKKGPPLEKKEDVERFKEKNKEWFIEGERIYAKDKRDYTNIRDYIESILPEISGYVKECKNVNSK